jgi:hypothetical protein
MNPLPFAAIAWAVLVPFIPVRVLLIAGTVLALWLAVSLAVHFLFFLPLMRRNSQIL